MGGAEADLEGDGDGGGAWYQPELFDRLGEKRLLVLGLSSHHGVVWERKGSEGGRDWMEPTRSGRMDGSRMSSFTNLISHFPKVARAHLEISQLSPLSHNFSPSLLLSPSTRPPPLHQLTPTHLARMYPPLDRLPHHRKREPDKPQHEILRAPRQLLIDPAHNLVKPGPSVLVPPI